MRWRVVLPIAFEEAHQRAERLSERTCLGVGGRPRFLFEPTTEAECGELIRDCRVAEVPSYVLGGGFNLLVGDGLIDGAVIWTGRLRHFRVLEDRVEVGAGYPFPKLVRQAIELGIPGLPGCPGIPGTVGGVVFMNAGGRFGSVSDALIEVSGLDAEGQPFRRVIQEGDLGYRSSPFAGCVVTGATFRRDPGLDLTVLQALFRDAMAWKRETQPLSAQSAGCIFKNPAGTSSAGRLIEEAGLKGRRVGGAMVSHVHANFIVNVGGATAADVHALIDAVQQEVLGRHGVALELEVRVWGGASP